MKISKTHQKFSDLLHNQRVLEHPEEFLGENWKDVLNFWLFLDTLSLEQWEIFKDRYRKIDCFAWDAARVAARVAARGSARDAAARAACCAAWDAAWYASVAAAGYATYEIIGSHIILNQNKPLIFLPMFLNVTP